MSSFQITGIKLTSSNPNKTAVLQPKVDKKPVAQPPAKKPSIAKNNNSTVKKIAKPVVKKE